MSLKRIRRKIDCLDLKILSLLEQRFLLSLQTKKYKTEVEDLQREAHIFQRLEKLPFFLLSQELKAGLFLQILNYSRQLQKKSNILIGFQGWWGCFSHQAARRFNAHALAVPCRTFLQVVRKVVSGDFDYGVLPVFNLISGTIKENIKLFRSGGLKIVTTLKIPVHHCLFCLQESSESDLQTVLAHPQAILQCGRFLKKQQWRIKHYYDGSGAVLKILQTGDQRTGIIAAGEAASWGLKMIYENIEDNPQNYTLFFIIEAQKKRQI